MGSELFSASDSLTIGVTGRRRIVPEALGRIEETARSFLRRTVENWTKNGPIFVLTGLAIGADQLAARLVLEEKERDSASPLRLVATLPMDAAEYSNDFSSVAGPEGVSDLDEFRRFLDASDFVVEPSPVPVSENVDRTARYEILGEFLVERSQILLAFWNGNVSEIKRGGTTDVALRKTRRAANGGELVYCVSTPEVLRRRNPDGTKTRVPEPLGDFGKVAVLTPPTSEPFVFQSPKVAERRLARFLKAIS